METTWYDVEWTIESGREHYTDDQLILELARAETTTQPFPIHGQLAPPAGWGFCHTCITNHAPLDSLEAVCSVRKDVILHVRQLITTGFAISKMATRASMELFAKSVPQLVFSVKFGALGDRQPYINWFANGLLTHCQTSRLELIWDDRQAV